MVNDAVAGGVRSTPPYDAGGADQLIADLAGPDHVSDDLPLAGFVVLALVLGAIVVSLGPLDVAPLSPAALGCSALFAAVAALGRPVRKRWAAG
jgi:hypothetical protein